MKYEQLGKHFAELSAALLAVDRDELKRAIFALQKARRKGANVWIVGNGGSAATASHFANDLVKMGGVRAFAVADMLPTVTAYGNDEGWNRMFELTISRYYRENDVVVAISCSGKSANVIKAAHLAGENLIVLTGSKYEGNVLLALPAAAILPAMSDDITIQEDIHLAICHVIAKALRDEQ